MNTIIYTRFSPRRNAGESESCETQEALCREFAEKKGWNVRDVIHDPDASGADEYREPLWRAIDGLGRGDTLLVYKRDRLARNVYLAEQINRAVKGRGATIAAVSGDVEGDSAEVEMIRQVLASIAEYERKMIAQRTRHAMRQHQRSGRRMGRFAPYGWSIDPDDPARIVPDAQEQVAIEWIRKLSASGLCPHAVMRRMDEIMPEAARQGKWNAKTITRIIDRLA